MRVGAKWTGVAVIGALSLVLAGCGSPNLTAAKWMTIHPSSKTIDLKVESTYSSSQQSSVLDGFTRGGMVVTIPEGYHVKMDFINHGPIPESIGVYRRHHLAFPGAGESYRQIAVKPTAGILPGQHRLYKFTATKVGTYMLADWLNGGKTTPTSDIWDTVKVVSGGNPSVSPSS
ncbi:MAG: hypothetical protein M1294_05725 [Firmicutes bacterium]|jgi:hypothetical protein|uniref:Uncharacterized protein n=1 Tax=Sulfobacillus benefaciens TaxID=453960 RepID=A0A2T2WQA2_9FIRM|nr:hypothetical protein [Bacillota bacterium]MCL5013040.1 hypothetical protein [Bacillota bacterium]PSR24417.1 MAG: hypothetical protein C7B43_19105 [Sulfobacillus benefaciens]